MLTRISCSNNLHQRPFILTEGFPTQSLVDRISILRDTPNLADDDFRRTFSFEFVSNKVNSHLQRTFYYKRKEFLYCQEEREDNYRRLPQQVFRGCSTWTHRLLSYKFRWVCVRARTGDHLTVNLNHKIRFRPTSLGIICTKRQLIESV